MRDETSSSPREALLTALLLGALLASCGNDSRVRQIEHSRTYAPVDGGFKWNATPQERFRFSIPPAMAGAGAATGGGLHYETPPGWQELPPSAMRQANFRVGGEEGAECYLTILPGDGGGLVANVNRWRKQMSLPPASEAEVAALPHGPFFDDEATFVDLDGTFTGMSGDEAGAGFRMVGFVQVTDGAARFLKLVGPASVVESELAAFLTLAASFHQDQVTDPHAGLDMGAGGPMNAATAGSGAGGAAGGGSGMLTWKEPEGWQRGPDRPMREVTFQVGDQGTECYVVVLGGTGGGVEANINRWRNQMGASDLPQSTIDALPRFPFLGHDGVLVEIPGSYTGMGDADVPDALMLGAVCMLPQASVFVKMVGPRDDVEGEREAFLEFCRSMELAR